MKYCDECGKPNETLANFCCKCSNPFVNLSISSISREARKNKQIQNFKHKKSYIEEEEDVEDDNISGSERLPNIESLDVEITQPRKKVETIGDIYGTCSGKKEDKTPQKIKINKKEILAEIKRESSAIKRK